MHAVRMVENIENDIEFSHDLFLNSLEAIRKKGNGKYKFIRGAGQAYLAALFKLFKIVWDNEKKPDCWKKHCLNTVGEKG